MYFRIFQSGVRDCFKEYFEVYFKVNKTITDGGSTAPQICSVIRGDYLRTQRRFKRYKRDSRVSKVGPRTSGFAPSARSLLLMC